MSAPLEAFLSSRMKFPGLAAWSLRLPDRTVRSQSYATWVPVPRAEQVLGRLALAADGLQYHNVKPRRLCWKFEHVRFHLALGVDGSCLAVVIQTSREQSRAVTEAVLEEFVRLWDSEPHHSGGRP